ncbi:hypothetical protein EV356DRAFT_153730 [Viridothelium virens]|uniref:Uncharacterized protein n=1 Tax=Viridothelium virens TaxID=1048519 RepID=A0A6A6H900_VIRVR|nr:hypothetical protein EV356DRAFT_153730 [Viridothelium virens]
MKAGLIAATNGVHSTAVEYVLGHGESRASSTGWVAMRWLVPTEELVSDPDTSSLIKESALRPFIGSQGISGLVWYPCRKE